MDDDLVSSVQDALQHLFKKPKLSAKLLGKPPFRFLHDVVMAVSSATGFASTLYTDEEKDSGNYKDKAGKIDFLQKIVTLVGICEGSEVDIRCAKVVAGIEPEKTSAFLILLGKHATSSDLDFEAAATLALNGEQPGCPIPTKNSSSTAEEKTPDPSPPAESKNNDFEGQNLADRPMFNDADVKVSDQTDDRAQTRSGTRGGNRGSQPEQTSDAGLGGMDAPSLSPEKGGGANLDAQIEECNSDFQRTREVMEKIISKPKCSEKLLGKPPFRFLHDVISAVIRATGFAEGLYTEEEMDSKNVKDKSSKIEYLEKILKHVGETLNTFVDARPAKIVAGLEPENTSTFLQLLALAATAGQASGENNNNEAGGESKENEEPNKNQAKEEAQQKRPSPEKRTEVAPAKEEAPQQEAGQQAKGEDKPLSSNNNANNINNNDNDKGPPEKKSMRPSTARRRPPKVKSTSAVEAKEVREEAVVKTKIMKEGEKDDAFFDDDDDEGDKNDNLGSKHVTDASLQGKQHGKLVQNIMNEQEAERAAKANEEEKADDGKKGIRLKMNLKKSSLASAGVLSAKDMEQLTNAVQRLVQSTAPLGKCMDYVQEDLGEMAKERERWQTTYRAKIDDLEDAKKRTEDELDPLRQMLSDFDDQLLEKQQKIKGLKNNIAKNDARIEQLLRSACQN